MRAVLRLILVTVAVQPPTSRLACAQTNDQPSSSRVTEQEDTSRAVLSTLALYPPLPLEPDDARTLAELQPAGPPPTPRHTGVGAMVKHFLTNFKYLPAKENVYWAAAGGGLAFAAHPFDDDVNTALIDNTTAESFFKPGAILGEVPTLLGTASVIYAIGRIGDHPKASHLGMDLIEAIVMSEAITIPVKYAAMRERPDGSNNLSFPSGHAADTFAFATALERHLNWRYSVPAYVFASYVAVSRLVADKHWLSDVVFGASVGIIAGRTVTSHEAERPFPVAITFVPGGVAVLYARTQ
jgi:membrane-associated phospholipid phosphatase